MKRNSLGLMCALALLTLTVACSPGVQATQKQSPKSAPSSAKLVMPAQPPKTLASVGFVEDPEQLFSPTERGKIDTLLRNFEKSNLISIKLVTISDPEVTMDNFDQHNGLLLQSWSATHHYSEHCMTISISRSLRRMRIDFGAFVQKLLSNEEASAIIENVFKPSFKQSLYYKGTTDGVIALMDTIRKIGRRIG